MVQFDDGIHDKFPFDVDAHGFETGNHSNLFKRNKLKRILPLSDSDDDL